MKPYFYKQLCVSLIPYIGQTLSGIGVVWGFAAMPQLMEPSQTPLPHTITNLQSTLISYAVLLGTVIGPWTSIHISNTWGRKPCFFLGGVLTFLSFLLLALSWNVEMILAGRFLTGMGISIIMVINLVYIGEIASTNVRGVLLTSTGIFSSLGFLLVYLGSYVTYFIINIVPLVISLTYIIGLFYIPESPTFFFTLNQNAKAIKCLKTLDRSDEVNELVIPKSAEQHGNWKDLFLIRSNRKALFITVTLSILQQLSGADAIMFYLYSSFYMFFESFNPTTLILIVGGIQLVSRFIGPIFVERSGGKILLMASAASCCICLALLGLYWFFYRKYNHNIPESLTWIPMVVTIVYLISYNTGLSIIPKTLAGELFQSNMRSKGAVVAITSGWLFNAGLLAAFIGILLDIAAYITLWIFAVGCACTFIFAIFFVPETKGKTFAEIQELLS